MSEPTRAPTPKLWEQWTAHDPPESDAAYARFLLYCHLGPTRSLDAAYAQTASKRVKSRRSTKFAKAIGDEARASGTWAKDSATYDWERRAKAWDVDMLADVGKGIVVKYVYALDAAFAKILQTLHGKAAPRTWAQAIEALTILGSFIPQETVAAIRADSEDDTVPAIGAGSSSPVRTDTRPG